jgi:hypothetical protein
MRRNSFGRGFGPVVRQNTEWMNDWICPPKSYVNFSSSRYVPHVPPIWCWLIWSPEVYFSERFKSWSSALRDFLFDPPPPPPLSPCYANAWNPFIFQFTQASEMHGVWTQVWSCSCSATFLFRVSEKGLGTFVYGVILSSSDVSVDVYGPSWWILKVT